MGPQKSLGALGGVGGCDGDAVDGKAGGDAAGVNESEATDTAIGECRHNLEKGREYQEERYGALWQARMERQRQPTQAEMGGEERTP
jgi:hypothetical protein